VSAYLDFISDRPSKIQELVGIVFDVLYTINSASAMLVTGELYLDSFIHSSVWKSEKWQRQTGSSS
jgi:hypothetical protein